MVKKEKQNSSNETSPLRIPKVKKRFGLKVPDIRMPHLELVQPEGQDIFNDVTDINKAQVENIQKLPQTRQTTQTRQATQTTQARSQDISPTKDFQKVPNSLTRSAIPEGIFKAGKSKQLYDVLYSLTRGSINASHSIRISKTKLMKKASIGSRITFDTIISHFESIGLIEIKVYAGQHQGNEFKVFTYEESQTSLTSLTRYAQKLDRLLTLETRQTSHSLNGENNDTYSLPKTSLKTLNPDDEQTATFADFNKRISEASERITGKKINPRESKKWGEVADLLILELELAAARTKTVSSVPAFLKEVLRRKLETKTPAVGKSSGKVSKQMQVGKPDTATVESEKWEREVLTKEEREKTLQVMRERKAEGHLELVKSMEQTYTTGDWKWLMENIEES